MRFINLYLIGYFILIIGALAALWYGGVLRYVSGTWIAIGLIIAIGLGIMTGSVDIQNGGFAVPAAKTSFTGLTTRIDLQQEVIKIPRFQILDQHGKPLTISGELAVHQRQAGAVNIAIDSDDFKIMSPAGRLSGALPVSVGAQFVALLGFLI